MSLPEVRTAAGENDRAVAINTFVLGFVSDPVMRWLWPNPKDYLDAMPRFSEAFGGKAFAHNTAHLADGGRAAATWLPPGEDGDHDSVVNVLTETLPADRLDDILGVLEQMGDYHPHDPCWYLAIIAADANYVGRGLGAALMKHALLAADEAGLPAYLESSNIQNVAFYERHGFEVMGEIQVGTSPIVRPMFRGPR